MNQHVDKLLLLLLLSSSPLLF